MAFEFFAEKKLRKTVFHVKIKTKWIKTTILLFNLYTESIKQNSEISILRLRARTFKELSITFFCLNFLKRSGSNLQITQNPPNKWNWIFISMKLHKYATLKGKIWYADTIRHLGFRFSEEFSLSWAFLFKGSNDTLKMCSFFSFYLLPLMDANSEISHCLRLRVILKYPW